MTNNTFFEDFEPRFQDVSRKQLLVDNELCLLDFMDTYPCFNDYDYLCMSIGDGYVFMYSITSRDSFDELLTLRKGILKAKGRDTVPMVLIGHKCDLENDRQVPNTEGEALAKRLGCSFFEISAKERVNVEEAFHCLVRAIRSERLERERLEHDVLVTPATPARSCRLL